MESYQKVSPRISFESPDNCNSRYLNHINDIICSYIDCSSIGKLDIKRRGMRAISYGCLSQSVHQKTFNKIL